MYTQASKEKSTQGTYTGAGYSTKREVINMEFPECMTPPCDMTAEHLGAHADLEMRRITIFGV